MIQKPFLLALLQLMTIMLVSCSATGPEISGELRKWHTLTFTFTGPEVNEQSTPNPFLNFRLVVTFKHGDSVYRVRGFYAADGNAVETGADAGNKWQVRFCPDSEGSWSYKVSFRQGENIAVSDLPENGNPVYFDGMKGNFTVGPTDKSGDDFRGKGRFVTSGGRYLQFSETGEYFLKGGADSPENFLAYADFDGTRYEGNNESRMGEANPNTSLHRYSTHVKDWKAGDPTWMGGKGKGIIGALNYLASKGMNSVYFLTLNIGGDGQDVWPYTGYEIRTRFDCSKLDQWERVFGHTDKLGIMLHFVTQETENQLLLDSGYTRLERKLYYLELLSRFGHHPGVTWNMGEENGYADFSPKAQTREQQKEMVKFMKEHSPYDNFVVIHTHSNPVYRDAVLNDFLGFAWFDGPSVQIPDPLDAHRETLSWIKKSALAGKPWIVCIDEIGPAWRGVDPDNRKINNQDSVRKYVLWANLMAGGGGVEWYFGYKSPNNDLNCEDWRSRDRMWDYTRFALEFFQKHLPFAAMEPTDELTDNPDDYCLAQPGKVYAIYLPQGSTTGIDLSKEQGSFEVKWYNPRTGGDLVSGSIKSVDAGQNSQIGQPPANPGSDWVVLLNRQ
jgi:hypothetical protein